MTPKITVCIPTYNRAHFLQEALESLCHQELDRTDFVVAISDDASTDQTPEVVEEYRERMQIVYQRNPVNKGHIDNFQIAGEMSQTPYLSFLPDDDLVAPGQLARALSGLESNSKAVLFSSPIIIGAYPGAFGSGVHGMFLKGKVELSYSQPYVWEQTEWLSLALLSTPLSIIGSVFRREAYNLCHLWKSYPLWHDRLMLAELGLQGDVLSFPWAGGHYRVHDQQLNARLIKTHPHEFDEVTKLLLEICRARNIPVVDFWINRICISAPLQRAFYLLLLKKVLPKTLYRLIRRESLKRLNFKFLPGIILEHPGIHSRLTRLKRVIVKENGFEPKRAAARKKFVGDA